MLQRTLITAHISFQNFDEEDIEAFKTKILPETRVSFARLRKDIDLTIREIGEALGCGPMFISETQTGYLECLDRERAAYLAGKLAHKHAQGQVQGDDLQKTASRKSDEEAEKLTEEEIRMPLTDVEQNLASVTKRLQMELGMETPAPMDITRPDTPEDEIPSKTLPHPSSGSPAVGSPTLGSSTAYNSTGGTKAQGSPVVATSSLPIVKIEDTSKAPDVLEEPSSNNKDSSKPKNSTELKDQKPHRYKYGPPMIRQHFDEFQAVQQGLFIKLLISADPGDEDVLRIHQPGPSISELYGGDYLRGDVEEGDIHSRFDRVQKRFMGTRRSSTTKGSAQPPTETPSPVVESRNKDSKDETYDVEIEAGADDDEFDDDEEKRMRSKKQKDNGEDEDEENEENDGDSIGPTKEFKMNQTLVRVYSLLFAWEYVSILI
jgi:hypothetical protein